MSGAPFVIVGLGSSRSSWLARLSHWVTSGALPCDLSRCVTVEEFRAVLMSRPVSMALVDELSRHVDRDLLATVRAAGGVPVVVTAREPRRDWSALGADAVLGDDFEVGAVIELLRTRARPVEVHEVTRAGDAAPAPGGRLVAVCGPGGTGASTVAAALAQGLAASTPGPRVGQRGVVLVDMTLNGEQAVLHSADRPGLGLPGLVDAHRRAAVEPHELERYVVDVAERSYTLVSGIRRRRAWTAMRPRALHAAVSSLLSAYPVVVADTGSDLEGEPDGGSLDVEERNAMSRCAVGRADVVVVVCHPGVKGCYSLLRVLEDLWSFGVPEDRVLTVVNRCRGGRFERSEINVALRGLSGGHLVLTPVFVPDRDVEAALVDGRALPSWLCAPVAAAVRSMLDRHGPRLIDLTEPVPAMAAAASVGGSLIWDDAEDRPA